MFYRPKLSLIKEALVKSITCGSFNYDKIKNKDSNYLFQNNQKHSEQVKDLILNNCDECVTEHISCQQTVISSAERKDTTGWQSGVQKNYVYSYLLKTHHEVDECQ